MDKKNTLGFVFVFISMLLSLVNTFSVKITGAVIGIDIKSSFLIILTIAFFLVGFIFLSRIGKGLVALVLTGTTIAGISHKIHSDREKQYITDIKITAPYWTNQGKFQRTYRWDSILDEVEEKYKLPKGLLKGLAMRESYGDPLRLNSGKDGGAGLFMFQPRIARHYGLKVHGKSNNSSKDIEHGKELKNLIKKYKNNYEKLAKIDERFDIEKSAEAAAKYLKEDYSKYGSWDKTLSAYNQGTPAPNSKDTEHVKAVREYQKYYNKRDKH
ncbi:MAG: transglycosylase SLT domain-containing protein [Nanoarchaeota archaeon]